MANTSRIGAIDFWRGLVLIAILIDHVPGNGLEAATPRNYGFSDSAEAFVFLSGLSVGAIYVPRARKLGLFAAASACWKRALKLYGVHLAMTAAALAIFIAAAWATGLTDLITAHGRGLILYDPGRGASGIAMLGHQLGYFNILPLYIALMIWAPVALALTLVRQWLGFAASFALYVVARAMNLNLPNWPDDGHWFFNPLTWQLIFTCGVIAATIWRTGAPRVAGGLIAISVAVLIGAALLVTDGFGLADGWRAAAWANLDLGKQNLGLLRFLHFFAIAYLAAIASHPIEAALGRLAEGLRALGRHSLPVFAFGSLLAALGQAAMAIVAAWYSPAIVESFGLVYTLSAIAASFLLARKLDCETSFAPVTALFHALFGMLRARPPYWPSPSSPGR